MAEAGYLVAGAGLAGAKAVETLREEGYDGPVALVGEETERPYERPPLSKGFLLGEDPRPKLYVHDEAWYGEHDVELIRGHRVTEVDLAGHTVTLDSGEHLGYRKLLLATGAAPRPLDVPGNDLDGVHQLRRLGDAEALRKAFTDGGPVVVVGAGWIGLETAAAARTYGCPVTVVEPRPTPLYGVLGPEVGGLFADLHRRHGVDLRVGRTVSGIRGSDRVTSVVLDDGTELPSATVIAGVGVRPRTELAERAGLDVDNGIVVDASLRTADPDVYAAGDVANAHHPFYGRTIRVEHWANALNSGPAAARSMLGREVSYDPLPYFFTDQYDVGMEFSGWFPPGGY
ncbi:MAG: NAD(P)/FAD-dependent oxidoreductase, partial [Micromonosporaceae bacterium]